MQPGARPDPAGVTTPDLTEGSAASAATASTDTKTGARAPQSGDRSAPAARRPPAGPGPGFPPDRALRPEGSGPAGPHASAGAGTVARRDRSSTTCSAHEQTGRRQLAASPVLIGAVTILIAIVAVFISYSANQGLPFVPTYRLKVEMPNGAKLVPGNEVRAGGFRVGIVEKITSGRKQVNGTERSIALLDLKLDRDIEPLSRDSVFSAPPLGPGAQVRRGAAGPREAHVRGRRHRAPGERRPDRAGARGRALHLPGEDAA